MSYEVKLEIQQEYIRAEVSGTRTLGNAAQEAGTAGKHILKVCNDTDTNRVLLLLNLRGRLSALDSFEMVTESRDYGWTHAIKMAIVDLNRRSYEDSLFTETVAVNRSYSVKVFDNEADALEWLLDHTAKKP